MRHHIVPYILSIIHILQAKEAAKAAKKEAQHTHIKHVTEFESDTRDNKDLIDATPRPNFMPRGGHADLMASEAKGPNSDWHTYVPYYLLWALLWSYVVHSP